MDLLTEQDQDTLSSLEARVTKAVELIQQLRAERDTAREEAAAHEADASNLRATLKKMESERESLQTERKAVRTRIEKLLGQMDLLSSEA